MILVYDRKMPVSVNPQPVHPRKLAAVRREVAPGAVGSAWGRPLARSGRSFAVSRARGLRATTFFSATTRHSRARPYCATSVSRSRAHFKTAGEAYATETPAGEAAVAVYRGPYNRMNEAHDAIREWMAANRRESAGP